MATLHVILRTLHITAGTLTLTSGLAAMIFAKGSRGHRLSGNVFFGSMLVLAVAGVILSTIKIPNAGNIMGGTMAAYLVMTGWATVLRPPGRTGPAEIAIAMLGLAGAVGAATCGMIATQAANHRFAGYPPMMYNIFAGVAAFAVALDLKVIRRGGITGTARTTRHLWRMCLAFFMATGSFFFGQPNFVPQFMKDTKLYIVAGLLPLGLMLFWLFRVRVWPLISRKRMRGKQFA